MWMSMVIMLWWKIMCMTSKYSPRNYRKMKFIYAMINKFHAIVYFQLFLITWIFSH